MSARVFWGFLLVLVGTLFLGSNLGIVDWDVWGTLWRAWPVVLILWGVSVLLRPSGRRGAVLTGVVALLAVAGVVGYGYSLHLRGVEGDARYATGQVLLAQALDAGVKNVRLNLDFGAGAIRLDGKAPAGRLAAGTLGYIAQEPRVTYSATGENADLTISLASGAWTGAVGPRSPRWDIHLSPDPVYALDLDSGACSTELDLSALKVTSLNLSTGASSNVITFGDSGQNATALLEFGASSVTVRVPRSMGVKVDLSSALIGTNLQAAGLVKTGSTWMSDGYDAKAGHLDITVNAGAASFNLEWVD